MPRSFFYGVAIVTAICLAVTSIKVTGGKPKQMVCPKCGKPMTHSDAFSDGDLYSCRNCAYSVKVPDAGGFSWLDALEGWVSGGR